MIVARTISEDSISAEMMKHEYANLASLKKLDGPRAIGQAEIARAVLGLSILGPPCGGLPQIEFTPPVA